MPSSCFRGSRHRIYFLYAVISSLVLYLILTEITLHHEQHALVKSPLSSVDSDIAVVDAEGKSPRILLVSALFPLAKSKHSHKDYEEWLSHFLGTITTPVYFYAPPSIADTVIAARGDRPIYVNTSYTSPFDIPPLQSLQSEYEHLHTLDREAFRHNPELYAVWNAKPWLLDNAVQHQRHTHGEEYDYAFWNDAGSFRGDHSYTQWPSPERVQEVWRDGARLSGRPAEELLFFPFTGSFPWLKRYWREDDGPIDAEISEGSFFGGSPATVSWWSKVYYVYHDYYLRKGLFVGKDQTLINALFLLFPSRVIGVWSGDPSARHGKPHFDSGPMGECGTPWFYYQFFMAAEKERESMQEQWMNGLEGRVGWPWKEWDWWLERQKCRMTRVVWMEDMVWNAFGKGWAVNLSVDVN